MKILSAAILLPVANAFIPSSTFVQRGTSSLSMGVDPNLDLSGNTWKPTEGRMQSTDTGDYLPEGYVDDLEFSDGMLGSQAGLSSSQRSGPELPGMENLGEDSIMMGGIELAEGIPEGMEFIPASVPDDNYDLAMPITTTGKLISIEIKPFCMGYEDYYAAFAAGSHPVFKIQDGAIGRMDRRGGEYTYIDVMCDPRGQGGPGTYEATLVVNIPEDDSKLTYTFTARVG
eukprot:CAMPEP_0198303930 /NCGR_PEP_ID=MMETSP1449-20131203/57138_1 /TAXON_ID=420275 /ORGANISM="Attheya septentrionalis, Strain CCMP2084" /LENGTH=228 /DNA_ID=CAMNT_0044006437 /DNA_START=70 /DNA_END=756 /DNA_ORIENTATION=-